ncbi:hypothetical protein AJ79_02112 [Helicocarpus griseus UAMH5409]|uniref:DUF7029 domain-containing protein n=1 Tax=Helicocarpus griseus UAMH5409 TaxID=1447875 RepID=A0A2B7Y406_9EURO|nr:hypothetical protein AJ79_02112 [Helicocarpus griseus UAMH5409]
MGCNAIYQFEGGRCVSSLLKKQTSLDFLEGFDDQAVPDGSVFTASLTVKSQKPILKLEDIEPDLKDVSCSEKELTLHFALDDALEKVAKGIEHLSDLVVVSSHLDCNEDDQRAPHIITETTVHKEKKIISLSKTSCEWKDAFSMMEVSFARKPANQVSARRNIGLKKRQEPPPTPVEQPKPTRFFPSVAESAIASAHPTSNGGLDVSVVDKVIMPPKIPGASLFMQGVTLTCKNCSLGGNLGLSQRTFKFKDPDDPIELIDSIAKFIEHAAVQVDVDDLFAHIELATRLDLVGNALNFTVPLPVIPLTPFMIPGIIAFGVHFIPQIEVALTANQSFEFEYGFRVSVPFAPEILLFVQSFIGPIKGGVGATFNIPSVNVKVDQLEHVDGKCNLLPTNSTKPADNNKEQFPIPTLDVIGDFTNIVPSIELSVGAFAEMEIGNKAFDDLMRAEYTIAEKEFPLPTACLAFDKERSRLRR